MMGAETTEIIRSGLVTAGTGRVDITPDPGFPMGGWSNQRHEVSRANHLELAATALCLGDETRPLVVMITLDFCVLTNRQADQIRAHVAGGLDLPVEQVVVSVSHTHASPVTNELTGLWQRAGRELVEGYMQEVTHACLAAAVEASTSRQPVRVAAANGWSDLAVNRRSIGPDGKLRVGFNPHGPVVHDVPVIRLDSFDGDPVALIWSYAAHPIILSGDSDLISPEYPGVARRVLESTFPGAIPLFYQGASGDAATREALTADLDACERAGQTIGHAAAAAAVTASTRMKVAVLASNQEPGHWLAKYDYEPRATDRTMLGFISTTVRLPVRDDLGDPEERWADAWACEARLAEVKVTETDPIAVRAAVVATKDLFLRAEQAEDLGGRSFREVPLVVLRLNDAAMVLTDTELFASTALDVMERSPFDVNIVGGHTNGYRNYLPTEDARRIGGYEVDYTPYLEGSEQLFRDAAAGCLEALR